MAWPLRFCHFSTFFPPYSFGGDAIFLHRLVNALARRGHEVDVIHCADSYHALQPARPTQQFSNHPNVTVHTLKSRWGFLSPLLSQQTGGTWLKTERIREVLLSKKFDVIHYHNISLLGPKVLQLEPDYRDFIKLYTAHEHWLICPMHVLWKNNERPCEKPECFRCTLKFRRPPQWWRSTRLLERSIVSVDTFLSPSRFTRNMHHERGFRREFEHLPHFLPFAEGTHVSVETPPHPRPYFLFVGRLEKIKGVQAVLPAFRNYPQADLLVAGIGTYESELRQRSAGMSNVVFLGALQQDRLEALYRHAIAVIVPSVGYEVFGIVVLEACRQRTPVIAHALGGLQEAVEESQGGFVYRTDEQLLEAMNRLQSDPELRGRMGERGYQKLQERWSEEAHLENYFKILRETARKKLGRVPWESGERATLDRPHAGAASLTILPCQETPTPGRSPAMEIKAVRSVQSRLLGREASVSPGVSMGDEEKVSILPAPILKAFASLHKAAPVVEGRRSGQPQPSPAWSILRGLHSHLAGSVHRIAVGFWNRICGRLGIRAPSEHHHLDLVDHDS